MRETLLCSALLLHWERSQKAKGRNNEEYKLATVLVIVMFLILTAAAILAFLTLNLYLYTQHLSIP